jgi:hypothetical protein
MSRTNASPRSAAPTVALDLLLLTWLKEQCLVFLRLLLAQDFPR